MLWVRDGCPIIGHSSCLVRGFACLGDGIFLVKIGLSTGRASLEGLLLLLTISQPHVAVWVTRNTKTKICLRLMKTTVIVIVCMCEFSWRRNLKSYMYIYQQKVLLTSVIFRDVDFNDLPFKASTVRTTFLETKWSIAAWIFNSELLTLPCSTEYHFLSCKKTKQNEGCIEKFDG